MDVHVYNKMSVIHPSYVLHVSLYQLAKVIGFKLPSNHNTLHVSANVVIIRYLNLLLIKITMHTEDCKENGPSLWDTLAHRRNHIQTHTTGRTAHHCGIHQRIDGTTYRHTQQEEWPITVEYT
jgi:hypothetical protein